MKFLIFFFLVFLIYKINHILISLTRLIFIYAINIFINILIFIQHLEVFELIHKEKKSYNIKNKKKQKKKI